METAAAPVKPKLTATQAVFMSAPLVLLNVMHALLPNAPDVVAPVVGTVFGLLNFAIFRSKLKSGARYALAAVSTVLSVVAAFVVSFVLMVNAGQINMDKVMENATQKARAERKAEVLEKMNSGLKTMVSSGGALSAAAHFEGDTIMSVIRLPVGKKGLDDAFSGDMHEKLKEHYDCPLMHKLFENTQMRSVVRYEDKSGKHHVDIPVSDICGVPPA